MDYIQGDDRHQTHLFPASLEEYVSFDNPIRFIDAYVESLDMLKLRFTHARLASTGRPPYRPQDLLKLYIYGYLHRIRSSRALERETHRNIELLWLLGKLQPDFKTIADFRKNNTEALKSVCSEFVLLCKGMDLFGGELVAIDGSKFEAVNHSSASFTRKGLGQALAATGRQLQEWLEQLDQADHDDPSGPSGQDLSQKIAGLETYRAKLEALARQMEDSEQPGGSLTDPDSRKMRTGHGGSDVSYNVQIVVDSAHKLIVAHAVSSEATDLHQLLPMARQAKDILGVDTLEVTADKGYYNTEQIAGCQTEHIRCYVPAPQGNGGQSRDLFSKTDFTYLPALDSYRCPAGQLLPYKSTVNKQGKRTRIYETSACQGCPLRSRCTTAKKGNRRMYRWIYEGIIEAHKERTRQNPEKIKQRGQLAEHPFGTLKRAMGAGYFLTKGLEKVSGEMSLSILAYNMKRVLNIMGVAKLMKAIRAMEKLIRSFLIPFCRKYRQNYLIPYFNVPVSIKSL
jgi:transposase